MNITKDSIVTSIFGIKSNITLSELCEHIGENSDEIVQDLIDDQYVDGGGEWTISCDESGENLYYNNHINDDYEVTSFLERIFNEKYLMMVTSRRYYSEYDEKPTSPTYLENCIENESLNICITKVTKDHHEEETMEITSDNFLSDDEKKEWEEYRDNSEIEHTYDYGYYFMKQSDFDKDKWWLGWTIQE